MSFGCDSEEARPPQARTETTVPGTTALAPSTSATAPDATSTTAVAPSTDPSTCSAAGLASDLPPQELPEPVQETRRAIVRAAGACDYEGLAQLALTGTGGFSYSFGESGAPADFWRRAEAAGDPVLRTLVEILRLPVGIRSLNESTQYVWPSAYAYERWAEVPPADREALLRVYDHADLRGFEQFGSYSGYRVGIDGAGDWSFFLAGD